MESNSIVSRLIEEYSYNEIFNINNVRCNPILDISEEKFYEYFNDLECLGIVECLQDELYYRPKITKFGKIPISEEYIAKYFVSDNDGIYIGYRLYNNKGLTTQISKNIQVISTFLITLFSSWVFAEITCIFLLI